MATMTQVREYTEFARIMTQERGSLVQEEDLAELIRLAGALQRINEADCNDGGNPKRASREKALQNKVLGIVETGWAFDVKFNGDPRGYAVKILLPSGRYNTMGGREEGWGVPS